MINNKGMTLVEEIVALAIISIASLIMLVGFSTAANVFADSTRYRILIKILMFLMKTLRLLLKLLIKLLLLRQIRVMLQVKKIVKLCYQN